MGEKFDDTRAQGAVGNCYSNSDTKLFVHLDVFSSECLNDDANLEDDELCLKPKLAFMEENEDDICVCRRCRSLSNSLVSPVSQSYTSAYRKPSLTKKKRTRTLSYPKQFDGLNSGRIFGSDEPEVVIADGGATVVSDDDIPILNESSEEEEDEVDHCHVQKSSLGSIKRAKRKLLISSCLCLVFMLAEIIGGYLSNSLSIMTDAAHLLSDLASFLISLFAIWVGQKAPTKQMSFGYYRAEVLGAVVSVLLIWVLTGVLVYMAVDRVRFPDYEIDSDVMLIVAGCGVAMNIIMGIVLHGPSGHHGHSHGSNNANNEHGDNAGNQSNNINVRAAFIHVIGDLFQSVGVLVAAYIIHYYPQYKIADPICTFIFSVLVMLTTLTIMRDAVHVLMEGFPREINYGAVQDALLKIEGVKSIHSLHIWSLTIDKNALSVHLAVDSNYDCHKVLKCAQTLIRKQFMIYNTTIQVEKYNPEAMSCCDQCQGP